MSTNADERVSSKVQMVDEANLPPHRQLRYGEVRYTLGHQIARGGYSTVYKAHDSWLNTLVVKAFNEKASAAMWQNEVHNHQVLRHPHIVYMHGAFELEGTHYLILEHAGIAIGRINLNDEAERRLILFLAAKGMLQALHFIHRAGYVHTDINPGNALLELTMDEKPVSVKICDLGLTRKSEHMRPGKHKAKWNPSPETIDSAAFGPESPKMDVYSTALVLMEILNGEELQRFTEEEICKGSPREMAKGFNEPLGDALAVALEPDSRQRISAYDFWKLIRKAGYRR